MQRKTNMIRQELLINVKQIHNFLFLDLQVRNGSHIYSGLIKTMEQQSSFNVIVAIVNHF